MSSIESSPTSPRYFVSSDYVLPSDIAEKARLDLQHRVLLRAFGNKLIFAPVRLKAGDKVLESGTGTGIWMLDFASTIPPTVEVYGIDLSNKLFPSSETSPLNLKFSVESVTSLPASWSSQFTFVRQRFLMAGLTSDMWKEALAEIWRVLVPGGWIELTETSIAPWGVGPKTRMGSAAIEKLFLSKNLLPHPNRRLPELLQEAGFVDERMETIPVPLGRSGGDDGIDMCSNFTDVIRALKAPVLELNKRGFGVEGLATEEEYDAMTSGCEEEWLESKIFPDYYVIVARKPVHE